jgi:hypothetical protein
MRSMVEGAFATKAQRPLRRAPRATSPAALRYAGEERGLT